MKLNPDKVGAEPKKLIALGALLVVAAYFYFSNSSSGSSPGTSTVPAPQRTVVPAGAIDPVERTQRRTDNIGRETLADFHPSMKRKKDFDATHVDPTLRLGLLDKLQQVPLEGGMRSLFDFSQEPVKEVPPVNPAPKVQPEPAPLPAQAVSHDPPPPPPAPPIPLKFYGFVSATNNRKAFFLDGDDIVVAGEGDLIKKRYKVVRVNMGSAVLEDEQFKSQQTITLVEEQPEG